jgi:hypothetical protein
MLQDACEFLAREHPWQSPWKLDPDAGAAKRILGDMSTVFKPAEERSQRRKVTLRRGLFQLVFFEQVLDILLKHRPVKGPDVLPGSGKAREARESSR